MRVGAIQLNATDDGDRNLERADRLVREAAGLGAQLIVLPEKWTAPGTREQMPAGAQTAIAQRLPSLARRRPDCYAWATA